MNATRYWTREHELLHWLLMIATAVVLILAVAKVLGALDSMPEPQLLPDDMGALAKPLTPAPVKPFFPESPPVREIPPAEAAARLSMIFELHRSGEATKAIAEWMQVGLPQETAHWREIAMGAAYLERGDLESADLHLDAALRLMPGHAAACYFTALLRLEQAAAAGRVPDGLGRGDMLVSYTPMEDRAMYRASAVAELEMAIARAHDVYLDEWLVLGDPQVDEELIAPTAGDLMTALGAQNFVGKAHHVLFGLQLDQGQLNVAERHLAAAAETGIAVLHGYRDLGEAYLLAGEHCAAIRLGMRDLELNHPEVSRLLAWLFTDEPPRQSWLW